ncbi:HlyD family efflux transporter periplasmic adaptor subunit [Cytophagaceae bacterium ABcell3]|nr:HlyD family efflux transporter periplasmic adaptor subunit [Cytophagaceae bacterium ABcell3]
MYKYIIILAVILLYSCGSKTQTYVVGEEALNEAVYASGEVMPAEYYFLRTSSADRILRSLVKEGDTIKQGDVISVIGTSSENKQLDILTRQVILAQQNVSENSAQLNELQGRIRLARQKYKQDSLSAERYKELAEERAVSQREYEQAKLQAEGSRTEYKNLQLQYKTQKIQLEDRLLNAEQQLAVLKQSREGKVLTTPINGIVYRLYLEEGELVQPHEPVAMVGLQNQYKLELLVDERDINRIRVGQKVYFETDAYANQHFEAKIKKIISVLQRETRSFAVEAEVLSKELFYPKSSVEANILIRENAKVLVIPNEYLFPGDSVAVKHTDGTITKQKVSTGITAKRMTEITQGLNKGEVIVKPEQ